MSGANAAGALRGDTSLRAWATVHLGHLRHNVREIRSRVPASAKLMAVVKADGYGHGMVPSARAVLAAGADALAVGTYDEAVTLRRAGISAPVLILSPIDPADVDAAAAYGFDLTVFQASWLEQALRLKRSWRPVRFHLKLDTGMGRLGLSDRAELDALAPLLRRADVLVAGVYTHFATANQADDAYVRQQARRFQEMRGWLAEAGFADVTAHCANSAAALRFPELAMDMVRVGASLFGILPVDADAAASLAVRLKPTLSVTTAIMHVKQIAFGQTVGYDRTYAAAGDEWIATLPVGYADGWFRGYRGFHVLVNGQRAPIVGNICMNQMMIRLPGHVPIGTPVTLLGADGSAAVTLDDLAAHADTIPQQVLAMIPPHVPRLYRD